MKMMKEAAFAVIAGMVIAAAAITAAYACGANTGGRTAEPKHDEITAMRLEAAKKQAELEELKALISLEERHLNAEEEADYRWVHGDAEVPEGKE
ncbi:NGO1622 family putative holin [Neisseria polysaccharea]|uniref:Phage associated protein n=1 Tax=Neisseria polysaccharea TaxID=489 RepID=A0ABV1JH10_NEIPO